MSIRGNLLNWLLPLCPLSYAGYSGAVGENRTPDLMITNQLLYQLSYDGESADYDPKLSLEIHLHCQVCLTREGPGNYR